MLEDRDYMRQPAYHEPRMSFTVALLILCAIVFVIECIACGYPPNFSGGNYFALSVDGLKHGYVWQLLTYQFMHAGLMHILLNGWAIYIFGRAIEETLGSKNFLILFLTSGVIGGIFQALAGWIWPDYFGGPVVGASAGAFGLVAAFAVLFPERELMLLLFFVLPLRLRAKTLLLFAAALAVFGLVVHGDNIANAAHLGGMLTGIGRNGNFQGAALRHANLSPPDQPKTKVDSGVPLRANPTKIFLPTSSCKRKLTRFSKKFQRTASKV